ncbi:MAG: hypothetical protein ACJA1U_002418, partial [Bermanella sp.]
EFTSVVGALPTNSAERALLADYGLPSDTAGTSVITAGGGLSEITVTDSGSIEISYDTVANGGNAQVAGKKLVLAPTISSTGEITWAVDTTNSDISKDFYPKL